MNINEKIKARREELGLSLEDVAKALGVNRSTILRYESEQIKKMPIDMIEPLARVLKCSPEYLMGWETDTTDVVLPRPEPVTYINVYSPLSCGSGLFVEDNVISTISVPSSMLPKHKEELFAQYADGDSMIGKGIEDGDLLIFSKEQCESGDVGCFCIDENIATCKTLKIVGKQILLLPANDKYDPINVDPMEFKCVGKLVLKLEKMWEE